MLGSGESFGEVSDSREGGSLKPGTDASLKDEKGVEIPIPCLEGEIVGRLPVGWVAFGRLVLESSLGMGECWCKLGSVLGCFD